MNDRARILERVRAAAGHCTAYPGSYTPAFRPPGVETAGVETAGVETVDVETFSEAVHAAGGEAHGPLAPAELGVAVAAHAESWAAAGRVVATPSAAVRLQALRNRVRYEEAASDATPHSFHDVALAIATGTLAVAEDGAVAVLSRDVSQRALLFLAERLILLVDARCLVPTLHEAFHALPDDALSEGPVTWIAGPSKTADIEQTLVLGAHGPRALAVFLIASHP